MHPNKKRLNEGQAGEQVCLSWVVAWKYKKRRNHILTAGINDIILYRFSKINRKQENRKSLLWFLKCLRNFKEYLLYPPFISYMEQTILKYHTTIYTQQEKRNFDFKGIGDMSREYLKKKQNP